MVTMPETASRAQNAAFGLPRLILALAHLVANHVMRSGDYGPGGFGPSACRSTLTVSAEDKNLRAIRAMLVRAVVAGRGHKPRRRSRSGT